MKEINLPSGEYLLMESLKTSNYKIYSNQLCRFWNGFLQDTSDLPAGQWYIIGSACELTEELWKQIVDFFILDKRTGYRDYSHPKDYRYLDTAKLSGFTLTQANGFKWKSTLILRKQL